MAPNINDSSVTVTDEPITTNADKALASSVSIFAGLSGDDNEQVNSAFSLATAGTSSSHTVPRATVDTGTEGKRLEQATIKVEAAVKTQQSAQSKSSQIRPIVNGTSHRKDGKNAADLLNASSIASQAASPSPGYDSLYNDAFPALVTNGSLIHHTPSPTPLECINMDFKPLLTNVFIPGQANSPVDQSEQSSHDGVRRRAHLRQVCFNHNQSPSGKSTSSSISRKNVITSPIDLESKPSSSSANHDHEKLRSANAAALTTIASSDLQWPVHCQRGQRTLGPNPLLTRPNQRRCEIFLRHLPHDCFETEIMSFIARWTSNSDALTPDKSVYEIRVMLDYVQPDKSRGFAFALMATPELALQVILALDGKAIRIGVNVEVLESVDNCKLFVGSLPKTRTRGEILSEVSRQTNGVVDVTVYPSAVDKSKTRGFAFVLYESHQAASHARTKLQRINSRLWDNVEAVVDWAEPEKDCDDNIMSLVKVLFVRNLLFSTTEATLFGVFSQYGSIEKVKKLKDFAFIHFCNRSDALRARDGLNGILLEHALIEVHLAKPPPPAPFKAKAPVIQHLKYMTNFHEHRPQSSESTIMLRNTIRKNELITDATSAVYHHYNARGETLFSPQTLQQPQRLPFREKLLLASINHTNPQTSPAYIYSPHQQQWVGDVGPVSAPPSSKQIFTGQAIGCPSANYLSTWNNSALLPQCTWPAQIAVPFAPEQLVQTSGSFFKHMPACNSGNTSLNFLHMPVTTDQPTVANRHCFPWLPYGNEFSVAQQHQQQQQLMEQQYALQLAMLTTATANAAIRLNWEQQQQNQGPHIPMPSHHVQYSKVNKEKSVLAVGNSFVRRNAVGLPVTVKAIPGARKQLVLPERASNTAKQPLEKVDKQQTSTINLLEHELHQLSLKSGFESKPLLLVDEMTFAAVDNDGGCSPTLDTIMYRCEIVFPASPSNCAVPPDNEVKSERSAASIKREAGKVLHCRPPTMFPSADEAKLCALKFAISNWQLVVNAKSDSDNKEEAFGCDVETVEEDRSTNPPSLP